MSEPVYGPPVYYSVPEEAIYVHEDAWVAIKHGCVVTNRTRQLEYHCLRHL